MRQIKIRFPDSSPGSKMEGYRDRVQSRSWSNTLEKMSSVGKGGDVAPLKEVEAAVIGDFVPVEAIEVSFYMTTNELT